MRQFSATVASHAARSARHRLSQPGGDRPQARQFRLPWLRVLEGAYVDFRGGLYRTPSPDIDLLQRHRLGTALARLRVAINTLSVTSANEGIRTMLVGLVGALVRASGGHRYRLICSRANLALFEGVGDQVDWVVLPAESRRRARRIWHDQVTVPLLARKDTDVLFSPSSIGSILAAVPQVVAVPAHLAIPSVRRDVPGARLPLPGRIYYGPMMRLSHRRAAAVASISRYMSNQLVEETGLAADKAEAILLGIDPVPSQPRTDGGFALFVGTLYPYKNAIGVIDALALVRSRVPDRFRLVVVGRDPDGLQLPALRAHAAAVGLGDRTDLLGAVSDERLEQLYRTATVLVLASRAEGFGLPVLEAMAHGVPVIASNRTALPEVVGDAGILVEPDDPRALGEALVEIAGDPAVRARLARAGRRRANELSWDRAAAAYVRLFERVARAGHRPRVDGSQADGGRHGLGG